jgi:hypothetical protein
VSDEDVGLAYDVERLGVGATLEVGVERGDDRLPSILLADLAIGAGALLHLLRLHADDDEDVLEHALVEDGLGVGGLSSACVSGSEAAGRRTSTSGISVFLPDSPGRLSAIADCAR